MLTKHFYHYSMSGVPSNDIKAEPRSGDGCEADAFMNARAELLLFDRDILMVLLGFYPCLWYNEH